MSPLSISLIKEFIDLISSDKIEIYNEASIQYELAMYLRRKIGDDWKIQIERNVSYFNLDKNRFLKSEMDIVVFNHTKQYKHCIEIKFPRNAQHPEQVFAACKDVSFLEQLTESGFDKSYFIMLTSDPLFYNDIGGTEIFDMFRANKMIANEVRKPTGNKDIIYFIKKKYRIDWQSIEDPLKYFILEVNS